MGPWNMTTLLLLQHVSSSWLFPNVGISRRRYKADVLAAVLGVLDLSGRPRLR